MQRVFVVDKNREPLMPCHPARARALLKTRRAKVLRRFPFTIIILDREGGDTQETQFKVDPFAHNCYGATIPADVSHGQVWLSTY